MWAALALRRMCRAALRGDKRVSIANTMANKASINVAFSSKPFYWARTTADSIRLATKQNRHENRIRCPALDSMAGGEWQGKWEKRKERKL